VIPLDEPLEPLVVPYGITCAGSPTQCSPKQQPVSPVQLVPLVPQGLLLQ
jgi:hypothetical protein